MAIIFLEATWTSKYVWHDKSGEMDFKATVRELSDGNSKEF